MFSYPYPEVETVTIPVSVNYFSPSGFFGGVTVTHVVQDLQVQDPFLPGAAPTALDSDFTLVDLSLGYRLPRRLVVVSLEARNIFDQDFFYLDRNMHLGEGPVGGESVQYLPELSVFLKVSLALEL